MPALNICQDSRGDIGTVHPQKKNRISTNRIHRLHDSGGCNLRQFSARGLDFSWNSRSSRPSPELSMISILSPRPPRALGVLDTRLVAISPQEIREKVKSSPRELSKGATPKSHHCSHLSQRLGLQGAHSATERARYHFRG